MSVAIAQVFEEVQSTLTHEVVIYRPTLGKLAGSVTGAMLLERIRYYSHTMQGDFYKFNDACEHPKYREGDSWQEQLGFTRYELEGARKKIATKVKKGDSKTELMQVFDDNCELMPKERIVLYWRDKDNVTWYRFNEDLYLAHLIKQTNDEIPNVEIQHYLAMRKSNITYLMRKSHITFPTEKHKETTESSSSMVDNNTVVENSKTPQVDEPKLLLPPQVEQKQETPKELPIPTDTNFAKVSKSHERWFGVLTPGVADTLKDWLNDYPADWICEAFEESAKNNARKINYADKILQRWKLEGMSNRESEAQKQSSEDALIQANQRAAAVQSAMKAEMDSWKDAG